MRRGVGVGGLPVPELTGPATRATLRPAPIYRIAFTREELLAHGVSANDAQNNAGVVTWTLRNGSWSYVAKPAVPR